MKSKKPKKIKLVCGIGINDADYEIYTYIKQDNGGGILKKCVCPLYNKWRSMLHRCTSKSFKIKQPSYEDVSVCDQWIYFSKFHEWAKAQEWEDMDLDKDILSNGEKVYSPETCAFIPPMINRAFSKTAPKDLPLGVIHAATAGKFTARCVRYLGTFETQEEAHKVWQEAKIIEVGKLIKQYCRMRCYRKDVHNALLNIVRNIRLDLLAGRTTITYNNQQS